MKRLVMLGLVLATAAVAYAAAGERLGLDALLKRFRSSQRLPALRSAQLPFRYPVRLWRNAVEGEVLLRIHITEAGTVDSVELERSCGHAELDSIALRGVTRLTYYPALQGEEAVAVWAVLPVRFQRHAAATAGEDRER
ncbi:MAG: energy transducer TonB [Gemmatimonadota bacterium]|nr:MAG: energy transducer TonB [Gemmatimonadota bacterium]